RLRRNRSPKRSRGHVHLFLAPRHFPDGPGGRCDAPDERGRARPLDCRDRQKREGPLHDGIFEARTGSGGLSGRRPGNSAQAFHPGAASQEDPRDARRRLKDVSRRYWASKGFSMASNCSRVLAPVTVSVMKPRLSMMTVVGNTLTFPYLSVRAYEPQIMG